MELLIKLAALSLCVSAVTALLKKSDEALSLLLLLAAVLVGCAMLLPALSELFDFCERALSLTDLPLTLFVPVVKVTAIALVARFSCALCADAGQSALSSLLARYFGTTYWAVHVGFGVDVRVVLASLLVGLVAPPLAALPAIRRALRVDLREALEATGSTTGGQDAVDRAREISQNQQTELVVHGHNGRIQCKDSHGHDPFPPKG